MRQRFNPIGGDPDDESIDWQKTRDVFRMVLRAPRRHPRLAAAIFVCVTALGLLAARHVRPTYQADAAVLIEKNVATPVLGDATKGVQTNDFDPGAEALEVVKGRENLVSLAKETHLFDKADELAEEVSDPQPDKARVVLKLLESRLTVKSDGNVVRLTADWTDPQTAYEIVSAALRSFLDKRSAAEVSVISDAITLLEEHAQTERDGIDTAMNEFLKLKEGWKSGASSGSALVPTGGVRTSSGPVALNPDLARRLEEKKLQIKAMDDERHKQMAEMKTQMAGLLGTYTPSHPAVVALQRKIDTIADEPSSMAALKNEERSLISELAAQTGIRPEPSKGASASARPVGSSGGSSFASVPVLQARPSTSPASRQDLEIADPASAMALSKLQSRIHKYEEFMDQITASKLELDLARNAFRYRYAVHKPPELPARPRRPVRLLLGAGGALLGLLLAFGLAALLDVATGRLVEPWQVKRRLALTVLGEVSPP